MRALAASRGEGAAVLARRLEDAGFPDPSGDARVLVCAACGDERVLARLVDRRLAGEPMAWLAGPIEFAGARVSVERGVYVPRPQTELLVQRAVGLLPERGLALDMGTGSGAVAAALSRARPNARVVATDVDPAACRCAAANGVEVHLGNLADPVPRELVGRFDVVVAVLPYVPTEELEFLPRDVRAHEPLGALDGGPLGVRVLEPGVGAAARVLRPGGALVLEIGGVQDALLAPVLAAAGLELRGRVRDEEGDLRGLIATRRGHPPG